MKMLIILFLTLGYVVSAKEMYLGLFASVVNLSEHDTLNVRKSPDYRSTKTGALPLDAYVGVDICREIGTATWCKIHHLGQHDYEEFPYDAKEGWVNAKYLKFINHGYVMIDKKANCDYALRCQHDSCEVVLDYTLDDNANIVSLQTKWVERKKLWSESNFGAIGNQEGYCTSGAMVEDYLRNKHIQVLLEKDASPERQKVIDIVSTLTMLPYRHEDFLSYIHPVKGIVMTWHVRFGGKEDMRFGYDDIKNIEKNRYQKIDWGPTYAKGDDVFMSLYDYMDALSLAISDITKIETLKELKGFTCHAESECKGYEVFWINDASDTKEYDWLGLVLILEKYHDKWYVVAMLRDRWTI